MTFTACLSCYPWCQLVIIVHLHLIRRNKTLTAGRQRIDDITTERTKLTSCDALRSTLEVFIRICILGDPVRILQFFWVHVDHMFLTSLMLILYILPKLFFFFLTIHTKHYNHRRGMLYNPADWRHPYENGSPFVSGSSHGFSHMPSSLPTVTSGWLMSNLDLHLDLCKASWRWSE